MWHSPFQKRKGRWGAKHSPLFGQEHCSRNKSCAAFRCPSPRRKNADTTSFRLLGTGLERECVEGMALEFIINLSFQDACQTATSCDNAWQTVATGAQNDLQNLRVRASFSRPRFRPKGLLQYENAGECFASLQVCQPSQPRNQAGHPSASQPEDPTSGK